MAAHKDQETQVRAEIDLPGTGLNHIAWLQGEEIINITSDHWVSVLTQLFGPALIFLSTLTLIVMRGMGWQFFVQSGTPATAFDMVNIVLTGLAIIFVLGAFLLSRSKGGKGLQLWHLLALGAIALLFAISYRYFLGGRIFYLDPSVQASPAVFFDQINLILMAVAVLLLVWMGIIYVECENDHLILTNKRVILSDRRILGKYKVDQISLGDIQNVSSTTNTYLQHYLKYGTLTVVSASQSRRGPIVFRDAEYAQDMQAQIMQQVKALQGQSSSKTFRDMVNAKVYNESVPKPPPPKNVEAHKPPPLVRYLIEENPIVQADGTIIWRPHWIFMVLALLRPVAFLVVTLTGFFVFNRLELLDVAGWVVIVVPLSLVVFFLLWAAYEIEDYRNDKYVLTPTNIEDIEQKPWGPTNKRTAGLGSIQNVQADTNLISRWIGYGDILLETAGGSAAQFTFHNIPDTKRVLATINNYRDAFQQGEKERTLGDALTILKHYHEKQQAMKQNELETLRTEIQTLSQRQQMLNEDMFLLRSFLTDIPPARKHEGMRYLPAPAADPDSEPPAQTVVTTRLEPDDEPAQPAQPGRTSAIPRYTDSDLHTNNVHPPGSNPQSPQPGGMSA